MRVEKKLTKISFAEFGTVRDYPFLMGLQLGFCSDGFCVMDGGRYMVNISSECKWTEKERAEAITKIIDKINQILKDAKVNYVSELVGKPVEVTIEDNCFKSFRILTEVL